jgi:hypothetical protein
MLYEIYMPQYLAVSSSSSQQAVKLSQLHNQGKDRQFPKPWLAMLDAYAIGWEICVIEQA